MSVPSLSNFLQLIRIVYRQCGGVLFVYDCLGRQLLFRAEPATFFSAEDIAVAIEILTCNMRNDPKLMASFVNHRGTHSSIVGGAWRQSAKVRKKPNLLIVARLTGAVEALRAGHS